MSCEICISSFPTPMSHTPHHPLYWQPRVYFLCLFILLLFVFSILYGCEIMWYLLFSAWFISLSVQPSGFIRVVTNGKISFFNPYGRVILHCIHILTLCYLSISLCTDHLSFSLVVSFVCGGLTLWPWHSVVQRLAIFSVFVSSNESVKLSGDRGLLWLAHCSVPGSWRVMPDM